jgi:acetyl esterase/lipase
LVQDAAFPAQIHDCNSALVYLRRHAAEYRLDPERVGVSGHSAGAHLAALMATTGNASPFATDSSISVRVQAAACLSGPFDLDRDRGQWPKSMFVWNPKDAFFPFFPGKIYDGDFARRASPTSYVRAGLPPMLIISGGKDTSVPVGQAVVFADLLREKGNEVMLVIEPEEGHSLHGAATRLQSLDFLERILKRPSPSKQ